MLGDSPVSGDGHDELAHCTNNPICHRQLTLTFIYAGKLSMAAALDRPRDSAFALLKARIEHLRGDCAAAAERITALMVTGLPIDLHARAVAWLIDALVQLDDLGQAHTVLAANDMLSGPAAPAVIAARAGLHLAAGQIQQAVNEYLACGSRLTAARITNPAVVPWRSRAALGAFVLSRIDLATALAEDELLAARRWGSPGAIGTALHPAALHHDDDRAVQMLTDAATLLNVAKADDEEIWTLHDLAIVLTRNNHIRAAGTKLERAHELACLHGYTRWSRQLRPALAKLSIPDCQSALTKQEARIADLAEARLHQPPDRRPTLPDGPHHRVPPLRRLPQTRHHRPPRTRVLHTPAHCSAVTSTPHWWASSRCWTQHGGFTGFGESTSNHCRCPAPQATL